MDTLIGYSYVAIGSKFCISLMIFMSFMNDVKIEGYGIDNIKLSVGIICAFQILLGILILYFVKYIFGVIMVLCELTSFILFTYYMSYTYFDKDIASYALNATTFLFFIFICLKFFYDYKPLYKSIKNTDDECSICYENKLSGDIVELDCGHSYHKYCILEWLIESKTCPYCRREVYV